MGSKSSPRGARNRINSFLFLNALLFEGHRLVQRLGRNFRAYKSWPPGFGSLLANNAFQNLISNSIKPARDSVVFRVGENDLAQALDAYSTDPVVFVTGIGPSVGNAYYDLADLLALSIYLGPSDDDLQPLGKAEKAFSESRDFAIAFLNAGDALIAEGLQKLGFEPMEGLAPDTHVGA